MKYCEKHEIDIKNYEDLEKYYDALLLAMKTVKCICDCYQMKNGLLIFRINQDYIYTLKM